MLGCSTLPRGVLAWQVFVKKPHPVGMSSLGAVLVAECDQLISEADERRTTLDGARTILILCVFTPVLGS
eukprot:m.1604565 g.1604565  ORF g.1604565 m.1604565 type:complete len:70 (+) comp25358_c0_seq7:3203-3412(+)